MRHLFAVSIIAISVATQASAAPAPKESWGKAGITLQQYRQDALDCGLKGYYADISQTQDAKEFASASRRLDNLQGNFSTTSNSSSATGPATTDVVQQMGQFAATQQHIIDGIRPEQRFHSIKQTLEATTGQCLSARGYSRFALTEDQRRAVSKLKPGSDQRRLYLYQLASNPAVLASQRAVATSSR